MKKIIIYLIFSLFSAFFASKATAQLTIYDTCQAIRPYEGEWRNISGQDTIKVYLRVHTFYSQIINTYEAEILGWHEYKSGSTVIQSDYSHRFDALPLNFHQKPQIMFSIGLNGGSCRPIINNLYGAMTDYTKQRCQNWAITRINSNTIQVFQVPCEVIDEFSFIPGFTLPQSFILTKQ